MLDFERLRITPINASPYRHIVVPHFVGPAQLAAIVSGLPALSRGGSYPIGALRLGHAARSAMRELEGEAFRTIIADRFALNLSTAPTMITLRGQSRPKDGRIHCDSSSKLVTVLLYLDQQSDARLAGEGSLRLLRSPDNLEDFEVEVPSSGGTLLVFPNSSMSWHGHRQFVGRRYVVQLNYMRDDEAARGELRRHRVSAIFKRLMAA